MAGKTSKITRHRAIFSANIYMLEKPTSLDEPSDPSNDERAPLTPFLKWPGGKRLLATQIRQFLVPTEGAYYEPFLGGGAVCFNLRHSPAFLSDTNDELINCYVTVRDNPEALINVLSMMHNSQESYYEVRSSLETEPIRRAARFIYLTTLSFNGIYRLNRKGKFNVPYGHKTTKPHFDSQTIRQTSKALTNTEIQRLDFETAVSNAKSGDTIYFDPPYTVAHGNNGFLKYNEQIFSWSDQKRLAAVAAILDSRGCRVVVSNAAHPSIADLYQGFHINIVKRRSLIAASSSHRKVISEYIIHN